MGRSGGIDMMAPSGDEMSFVRATAGGRMIWKVEISIGHEEP